MKDTSELSTGNAICLVICSFIALFHLIVGMNALSWRGAENYDSLLFVLVGMPLLVVEIILSILLFVRRSAAGLARALPMQIPLAVSLLMLLVMALEKRL